VHISEIVDDIPLLLQHARVADLVGVNGNWSKERIERLLERIVTFLAASVELGEDRCMWPGSGNVNFTVASSYQLLRSEVDNESMQVQNWKQVWKLEIHQRVRCFIWLMCHGKLLTNQLYHKMKLGDPHCHNSQMCATDYCQPVRNSAIFHNRSRGQVQVRWMPPSTGWIVLNTDGGE
jgi:hypothetical protein